MTDPYAGREQTKAKHLILKRYLQALAFKVLDFSDITYVDGFSGPWEARTETFADTSFSIAISVLQSAQQRYQEVRGVRRRVKCFFSETNADTFAQLEKAVAKYHEPAKSFEVRAWQGKFEDAVGEIQNFVGQSFALIFIDPTGWKGYPFDKIRPLFQPRKCEVLINFMYDYVNRFGLRELGTIESLAPILGGPDWPDRLDPSLPVGRAIEKLFRDTLRGVGNFKFVVSTPIEKPTEDRTYFFIVYGTKSPAGLREFRNAEGATLREHGKARGQAKERKLEERTKSRDLFAGFLAEEESASQEADFDLARRSAKKYLINNMLSAQSSWQFSMVVDRLLENFMLRETDAKDICVRLAEEGVIENTWGGGRRKPRDESMIHLKKRAV
jgi:three-Cys-motif partner protein